MILFYSAGVRKKIATFLLLLMGLQLAYPAAAFALTSGPSQPEFSSFEPVGVSDLVNKFTGDFSYRVPVLEVPGPQGSSYPLTLGYASGASAEDEASWVGYGWNLNAGAINRSARGLPDDLSGETTTYYNKVPQNFTITAGAGIGMELFSQDRFPISAGANISIRYNNYQGFGYTRGLGLSLGSGLVSLGVSESDSHASYSASINPMALLSILAAKKDGQDFSFDPGVHFSMRQTIEKNLRKAGNSLAQVQLFGGGRGALDYNEANHSVPSTKYTGLSQTVRFGATVNPFPVPVGFTGTATGNVTTQDTEPMRTVPGYGYLYTADAAGQSDKITDYFTEKDSPYSTRDVLLGIPFANADIYNVSGEGVGGNFQVHHEQVGDFSPATVESKTDLREIGSDISLGWTLGLGLTGSGGQQTLTESAWLGNAGQGTFSAPETGRSPFRFANDLGGTTGHNLTSDAPETARLVPTNPSLGTYTRYTLDKSPLAVLTGQTAADASQLPGQGAHIGQHTIAEMRRGAMFRYCRRADVAAQRYEPSSSNRRSTISGVQAKAIGEFAVTNESGTRYVYGLPLYARNESNMQYGVKGTDAGAIKNNFLVYTDRQEVQVGDYRAAPYATAYLMTDITTPDYVDRTLDGASDDDFGAYTSFYYSKRNTFTGQPGPYHWRHPYTGHLYAANSLSDPTDDMGIVSEGDKETATLQSVHTKTHTAIFYTSPREDGWDAAPSGARNNANARGLNQLVKLDRVELYANADVQLTASGLGYEKRGNAVPLKSVVFTYDYELSQQTPNSFRNRVGENPQKGKLTLRSVTTLYQGVQTAKPYVFRYAYPSNYANYPSYYQNLATGYNTAGLVQNPDYSAFCLDAWGNYQANGAARFDNLQTWPDQRPAPATFDPAAWQLKVIQLPSGGEIHVQYEADDYAYVQDQTVHALAALTAPPTGSDSPSEEFTVDPASVGLGTGDVAACCELITDLYVRRQQKMFFRFLYRLVGDNAPDGPTACNSDYVSGYVQVRSAVPSADGRSILLTVGSGKSDDYTLPKQVCMDFTQTQRLGKLQPVNGANCNPAVVGIDIGELDAGRLFRQFTAWAPRALLYKKGDLCKKLSPTLSYFKIPLPSSKKGGGLRVKRLLTFDPGLDGVPVLYGSEYGYQAYDALTKHWRSSGVATTEPGAMRAENALVSFIPRLSQTPVEKAISGPDRKQSEGPVGESVLPAAMVGYSRVTVQNIHSGITNPGYSISEYYTCKDFPVKWDLTPLQRGTQFRNLAAGLVNLLDNNVWSAQGFAIVLNNMHGQLRREATYAGPYDDINTQAHSTLVSEQQYAYFNPEQGARPAPDQVAVQNAPDAESTLLPARVFPGKDVEVTTAERAVRDVTNDVSLEGDLQITWLSIWVQVWVTGSASFSRFNSEFYTHTTSKVVRYPAIVKQVISRHDGIADTVDNLAFDRYTGAPVAVRSGDGGRGAYLKQDVPAAWVYPQLQSKAQNEGRTLQGATPTSPYAELVSGPVPGASYLQALSSTAGVYCPLLTTVHKGDVLALTTLQGTAAMPYTSALFFADAPDQARRKVRLYPYPATATLPTTAITGVTVLFSGNANALKTPAGSTTFHHTSRRLLGAAPVVTALVPTDALAQDLQQQLNTLPGPPTPGTASSTRFTLASQYPDLNVSGFTDRMASADCRAGADRALVRNLVFEVYREADGRAVKLQLVSFEMQCTTRAGATSFVLVK